MSDSLHVHERPSEVAAIFHDPVEPPQRPWQKATYIFRRNRTAVLGLIMVFILATLAISAPIIVPYDPLEQNIAQRLQPPSSQHWLGMDEYGRDVLTRVLFGARISLVVGITSVLIGAVFGTALGMTSAFFGGRTEAGLMRLVDIILSFPALITGLLILTVLGHGLDKMIIAIGIVLAPSFARLAHAATLSVKEMEYIVAARSAGASIPRILLRHILPNIVGELIVLGSLYVALAIRTEAGLSFIGLGVPPPTPTWGQMIRVGTSHLTNAPWVSISPGIAILATTLAFNLLGDGLRDFFDPKMQIE